MQSNPDGSTSANAFDRSFLETLSRRGEVVSAQDAEMSGPWTVKPMAGDRFGVFRDWEEAGEDGNGEGGDGQSGASAGDDPEAVFDNREHALLTAAVLPATGRDPYFKLNPVDRPEGYAVESVWGDSWVKTVGRIQRFQPEILDALHVAETLVRSPVSLAHLLEAAGPTALKLAGRILRRKLAETVGE
jgi:hypothetical protein